MKATTNEKARAGGNRNAGQTATTVATDRSSTPRPTPAALLALLADVSRGLGWRVQAATSRAERRVLVEVRDRVDRLALELAIVLGLEGPELLARVPA